MNMKGRNVRKMCEMIFGKGLSIKGVMLLAGICFFVGAGGQALATELSVDVKTNEVADGAVTEIRVERGSGEQAQKATYQGTVHSIKHNKDRTIYAINLSPGADMNDVYLIIAGGAGPATIVKDFNDQMRTKFIFQGQDLSPDFIHVDKIAGRILSVSSGGKGEPHYYFDVKLNGQNALEIISKSVTTD